MAQFTVAHADGQYFTDATDNDIIIRCGAGEQVLIGTRPPGDPGLPGNSQQLPPGPSTLCVSEGGVRVSRRLLLGNDYGGGGCSLATSNDALYIGGTWLLPESNAQVSLGSQEAGFSNVFIQPDGGVVFDNAARSWVWHRASTGTLELSSSNVRVSSSGGMTVEGGDVVAPGLVLPGSDRLAVHNAPRDWAPLLLEPAGAAATVRVARTQRIGQAATVYIDAAVVLGADAPQGIAFAMPPVAPAAGRDALAGAWLSKRAGSNAFTFRGSGPRWLPTSGSAAGAALVADAGSNLLRFFANGPLLRGTWDVRGGLAYEAA